MFDWNFDRKNPIMYSGQEACEVFNLCPRVRISSDNAQMHNRLLRIELWLDSRVFDVRLIRRLNLDASIQPAEALDPVEQSLSARHIVADFPGDHDRLTGFGEIGDLEFGRPAVIVDVAN